MRGLQRRRFDRLLAQTSQVFACGRLTGWCPASSMALYGNARRQIHGPAKCAADQRARAFRSSPCSKFQASASAGTVLFGRFKAELATFRSVSSSVLPFSLCLNKPERAPLRFGALRFRARRFGARNVSQCLLVGPAFLPLLGPLNFYLTSSCKRFGLPCTRESI